MEEQALHFWARNLFCKVGILERRVSPEKMLLVKKHSVFNENYFGFCSFI